MSSEVSYFWFHIRLFRSCGRVVVVVVVVVFVVAVVYILLVHFLMWYFSELIGLMYPLSYAALVMWQVAAQCQ